MKRFLATTALVTLTALPFHAAADTTATTAAGQSEWNIDVGETRVSLQNLIGARVYIAEGGQAAMDGDLTDPMDDWEDIGEIGDIYVDGDGGLASVIVDVGGFLGIGEREVALTMDSLTLKEDADDAGDVFVVYTGPRAMLEEQEEFRTDQAAESGYSSIRENRDAAAMGTTPATDEARKTNDMAGNTDLSMMVGDIKISADEMIGQSVYIRGADYMDTPLDDTAEDVSEGWERVGEIGDVVLSSDGQIASVVVDAGGFLGIGERHIRTDMDEVKFVRDSNDEGDYFIVFTGDRSKLEEREELNRDEWRNQGGSFYGDTMGTDNMAANNQNAAAQPMDDNMTSDMRNTLTADDLEGTNVYGPNEENIGEIGELVMGEDGKITQVIIDVGGFLGIGEKPVALNFDELTMRRNDGNELWIQTPYTQEELESMPDWEG